MIVLIWRIAWHAGFDGTHTAETAEPVEFIRELYETNERIDWVTVVGAYEKAEPPAA